MNDFSVDEKLAATTIGMSILTGDVQAAKNKYRLYKHLFSEENRLMVLKSLDVAEGVDWQNDATTHIDNSKYVTRQKLLDVLEYVREHLPIFSETMMVHHYKDLAVLLTDAQGRKYVSFRLIPRGVHRRMWEVVYYGNDPKGMTCKGDDMLRKVLHGFTRQGIK